MPGSHRESEMERPIEDCWRCGKMDCGRAGWTDEFHFSTLASQRKKTGRIRVCLDGNPGIRELETQTTLDPGWRLQREPVRRDRPSMWESRPQDQERWWTRTSHCERELFTRSSWSNSADSWTQMDFIMTSRKLDMNWTQIGSRQDHRAELAVLSLKPKMRYTVRNGANSWHRVAAETLTEWENWGAVLPLLEETARTHRRKESKELSVTELELKSLLLGKNKAGRQLGRSELKWLCREIWRKRRALKREKHLGKIKERAEMGKAPKKTQTKHINWSPIAKQENPNLFSQTSSKTSTRFRETRKSERRHWVELWKNLRVECRKRNGKKS